MRGMKLGATLSEMDNYVYPPGFYGGIGGKTFRWVFDNKKEWVEYTQAWDNSTGFFEIWLDYVKRR